MFPQNIFLSDRFVVDQIDFYNQIRDGKFGISCPAVKFPVPVPFYFYLKPKSRNVFLFLFILGEMNQLNPLKRWKNRKKKNASCRPEILLSPQLGWVQQFFSHIEIR